MLQALRRIRLVLEQGEAEGVERLALIDRLARSGERPGCRGKAGEPVKEQRLPPKGVAAFAKQGERRIQQPLVRRLAEAPDAQPHQKGRAQFADVGGAETVQGLRQRLDLGDQLQATGQLRQVPEHSLRLSGEGVKPALVEVGGGEARLVERQEAPGAIVEAFARDVQIVGVQDAVHETRGDPSGGKASRGLDDRLEQGRRVACRNVRMVEGADVLHQRLDLVAPPEEGRSLKRAEADVAVRQAHQHGGTGGGGLVAALQRLARLDQRKGAAGGDPLRLQHGGRQHLAHPALQRQPSVRAARPGRLA